MPAYNAGPWIAAAMQSVLQQTMSDLELIVIDDGSTDDTLRIAAAQAKGDARVVLLDGQQCGAAAARNRGLRLAHGRYVQHLDADDLLAPTKLEAQVIVLEQGPHQTLASARWFRFRGQPPSEFPQHRDALWQEMDAVHWLQCALHQELMMHPAAWLLRRELLEKSGYWDESLSLNDDGEFFARQVAAATRVCFVEGAVSWYRSGLPGSLSGRRDWTSATRALVSITRTLLDLDDSAASRRAAATAWGRLAVQLLPMDPILAEQALTQHRALDPKMHLSVSGGRYTRWLAQCLGWRLARRLQYRVRGY